MTLGSNGAGTDPAKVPIQHAATVLIVDDRPDLHVLCLRRRAGSAFVGGMTVFPGGRIDPGDADPAYAGRVEGLSAADADARLGRPGALAYWIAAVRETLEEVGVLLARRRDGTALDASVARHRHAVDAGSRSLLDVLVEEDAVLELGAVHDIGRWITPVGPPRRYDTRFFVTAMPPGQTAEADAVEVVHAEWLRPADAVTAFHERGLTMLPPTLCLLQVLSRFDDRDALLAAAAGAHGPGHVARVRAPVAGTYCVTVPGDVDHEHPDARDVEGWVYDLA
jgi:8-oxo-dGTP pyrophosphatase MutT (NUDIX family)